MKKDIRKNREDLKCAIEEQAGMKVWETRNEKKLYFFVEVIVSNIYI